MSFKVFISCFLILCLGGHAWAELSPILGRRGSLLAHEDFEKGHSDKWKFLHGTRFSVVDGELVGIGSTLEYQEAHPGGHSGKTPSSRYYVMSRDVIMQFRFQLREGLKEVHIGANDGTFKDGSGHVGRATFGTRSGLRIVKDRNILIDGDETEILAEVAHAFAEDTWYTVMVEFVGNEMAVQVLNGPSLRAKNVRFGSTKSDVNLPTRGGGKVAYDEVFVWAAKR